MAVRIVHGCLFLSSLSVPLLSVESAGMFCTLASLGSGDARQGWCSSTTEYVGSTGGDLRSGVVSQSSMLTIGQLGHPFCQTLSS